MANISNIQIEDLKLDLKDNVARDMVGSLSVSVDNKIDMMGINIKNHGAVGDGVADDSESFKLAISIAKEKNTFVFFPKGKYKLNDVHQTVICSLKGVEKVEILVVGNQQMFYDTNISLENIKFISDYTTEKGNGVGSLFISKNEVNEIKISNVDFIVDTNVISGLQRGKTFMRIKAKKVEVDNFYCENSKMCMGIENIENGKTDMVKINNFHVVNAQTGLYIGASVDSTKFVNNVSITNAKLVNTEAQSKNYTEISGSDLFMFENVKNINICDVYVNYACERAMYLNNVENVNITNVTVENTDGVKVVGYVSISKGIYSYAKNISISNVNMLEGLEKTGVVLYEVKNAFLNNIKSHCSIEKPLNNLIALERSVEDVKITNVTGKNTSRGIIYFNGFVASDYVTQFKNITVDGVNFINPTVTTWRLYDALRFDVPLTNTVQYTFENFVIKNVYVENRIINDNSVVEPPMYSSNANTKGLLDVDYINGLTVKDCVCKGICDINGGIKTGKSTKRVIVNGELYVNSIRCLPLDLRCSKGSDIKCYYIDSAKKGHVYNTIAPVNVGTDDANTVYLYYNNRGIKEGTVELKSGEEFLISDVDDVTNFSGMFEMYDDNAGYMKCYVTKTGVVMVSGYGYMDITNISGKVCLYIESGMLIMRNRINKTIRLNFKFDYGREGEA